MTGYDVFLEASGYGNVMAEQEKLFEALDGIGAVGDMGAEVLVNEDRGFLAVRLRVDATSGLDAHDAALEVWRPAWEEAFPEEAPPETLAIRCVVVAS